MMDSLVFRELPHGPNSWICVPRGISEILRYACHEQIAADVNRSYASVMQNGGKRGPRSLSRNRELNTPRQQRRNSIHSSARSAIVIAYDPIRSLETHPVQHVVYAQLY